MAERSPPVSRAEYDDLLERLEDLEAEFAFLRARDSDDGVRIPHEVLKAEIAGDHPIVAWRKHRGLTARALAARSGMSAAYLSEIVRGRKPGSMAAYRALANALQAPVDALLPEP